MILYARIFLVLSVYCATSFFSISVEVYLERGTECWDIPPASLHQWLQVKEKEQKEPFW